MSMCIYTCGKRVALAIPYVMYNLMYIIMLSERDPPLINRLKVRVERCASDCRIVNTIGAGKGHCFGLNLASETSHSSRLANF